MIDKPSGKNSRYLKSIMVLKSVLAALIFLLASTAWFTRRHILNLATGVYDGHFIEWGTVALYWMDILIIIIVLLSLLLKHKEIIALIREHQSAWYRIAILGLYLTFVSMISDYKILSAINSIRLFIIVIFIWVIRLLIREKVLNISLICGLILGLIIQSGIAIIQFASQKSIGLGIIGEQVINTSIVNVSEFKVDNLIIMRPYGTFLHPNLLGGFIGLITILVISLLIFRNVSRETSRNSENHEMFHVKHRLISQYLASIIIIMIIFGIIVSFSRSAWLALISGIVIMILVLYKRNVILKKMFHHAQRGHRKRSAFHVKHFLPIVTVVLCVAIIIWALFPFIIARITQPAGVAIDARTEVLNTGILNTDMILGNGVGVTTIKQAMADPEIEWWQIQPIHNSFILMLKDIGVIGTALLIIVILGYLNVSRETKTITRNQAKHGLTILIQFILILPLVIIMLLDHYPWSLPQGQLIVGLLILGLSIIKYPIDISVNNMINISNDKQ